MAVETKVVSKESFFQLRRSISWISNWTQQVQTYISGKIKVTVRAVIKTRPKTRPKTGQKKFGKGEGVGF